MFLAKTSIMWQGKTECCIMLSHAMRKLAFLHICQTKAQNFDDDIFSYKHKLASTNPTIWLENDFALLRQHMDRTALFQCIFVDKFIYFRPNELQLIYIRITCSCNVNPLTHHFYIVKLGFTGVFIFFLFLLLKHRLWVLVRTASLRRF